MATLSDDCLFNILSFVTDIRDIVSLRCTSKLIRKLVTKVVTEIFSPVTSIHPLLLKKFKMLTRLTCVTPTVLSKRLRYVHCVLPNNKTETILPLVQQLVMVHKSNFTLVVSQKREILLTYHDGVVHDMFAEDTKLLEEFTIIMTKPVSTNPLTYKLLNQVGDMSVHTSSKGLVNSRGITFLPPDEHYVCYFLSQEERFIWSMLFLFDDIKELIKDGWKHISIYPPFRDVNNKRKVAGIFRRILDEVTLADDVTIDIPYYPDCYEKIKHLKMGPHAELITGDVEGEVREGTALTKAEYHSFISAKWLAYYNLPPHSGC